MYDAWQCLARVNSNTLGWWKSTLVDNAGSPPLSKKTKKPTLVAWKLWPNDKNPERWSSHRASAISILVRQSPDELCPTVPCSLFLVSPGAQSPTSASADCCAPKPTLSWRRLYVQLHCRRNSAAWSTLCWNPGLCVDPRWACCLSGERTSGVIGYEFTSSEDSLANSKEGCESLLHFELLMLWSDAFNNTQKYTCTIQ